MLKKRTNVEVFWKVGESKFFFQFHLIQFKFLRDVETVLSNRREIIKGNPELAKTFYIAVDWL